MKTHLQSKAVSQIAVGHQHQHTGTFSALVQIYSKEGLKGLWRGSISSLPRIGVGSSCQLSSFSVAKEFLERHEVISFDQIKTNLIFFFKFPGPSERQVFAEYICGKYDVGCSSRNIYDSV